MRPKFLIALLLLTLLACSAMFFLKQHISPVPAPESVSVATAPAPAIAPKPMSVATVPAPEPVSVAPAPVRVVVKKTMTQEERQAAIDDETDRLQQWSVNDDPESLSNILADLTSPEKEICMAAIEATKQFDSTAAIPVLKTTAANLIASSDPNETDNQEEAMAMLDAANFLSMTPINDPSVQLPMTAKQAQAAEQKVIQQQNLRQAQMQMQRQTLNQNPQSASGPN
jgi:hypothetical protein